MDAEAMFRRSNHKDLVVMCLCFEGSVGLERPVR